MAIEKKQKIDGLDFGKPKPTAPMDELEATGTINTATTKRRSLPTFLLVLTLIIFCCILCGVIALIFKEYLVADNLFLAVYISFGLSVLYILWKILCVLLDIRDHDQIREQYEKAKQAKRDVR